MAALLVALLVLLSTIARAIDNPDAPDRIGTFNQRAAPFENRLTNTDGSLAAAEAGAAYQKFLDIELNRAFEALLRELEPEARRGLMASQRQWLRFRDTEIAFASSHWVRSRSGSSFALSRSLHVTGLIKSRVLALLGLLQEYPAALPE